MLIGQWMVVAAWRAGRRLAGHDRVLGTHTVGFGWALGRGVLVVLRLDPDHAPGAGVEVEVEVEKPADLR
jgi:hypothetical protein